MKLVVTAVKSHYEGENTDGRWKRSMDLTIEGTAAGNGVIHEIAFTIGRRVVITVKPL